MTRYLVRRILETIPVLIGASILVFLLVHLIPGGPEAVLLGERASDENVAALRERLGLQNSLDWKDARAFVLHQGHLVVKGESE